MKKPIIAVTALFDDEKDSIWMLPAYLNSIIEAGGIPIMLPLVDNKEDIKALANKFDGFLLTGGQDINPKIYNESKANHCGIISDIRDTMEGILLEEVLSLNKPILAICRGFQLLNSHLGGKLYQDISIEKNNGNGSIHRQEKPYDKPVHKVKVKEDSLLFEIVNKSEINVNSLHHQAIKELSSKVEEAGITEDGLIESIYLKNKKFVLGVQWHPELLYKDFEEQFLIFKAFINSCIK
ncbi:gamma-glutamyl-gamma-aminobutyrate hydrolase family protein [Clostridium sp. AL.422]|uniref:gamma-glutamyl-gamma-aminobutyrate hydrolase family protein n=1 Tax=Clostridium TaxID=1485 RepID=UPI00293DE741|nr:MULTISPECIES: gamma-glutamyl-gamma-aminobutyrate hydrolase family protein [unclassified Clostridium]MDV4150509.1 gamma-glutamyl-gamma-aminobutyrate hydrolase family protein [Clostridium sp. AL.422]